ncbi:DNA polymerase III subunit chi [Ponticoccus sp. SC2-23]|uniref:DNA polymerase III subunit chi n=1 Tax=Alexandriicola marinus TaxID=2081710 RepID=UPI000FDC63C2|nr:DNA polymerase III subunit chi [Alexandriicola marinus]MBM1219093.1 DNA polymerase III subunit chi [Ponticoccus sp. SC6-9]MBM1223835.1 DNA polymerase III subunit chi [Ponticoccus sp. SC6-15]MBM1228907.1 DNA polymerase III subunit chi [Ponticoccus sp. SC6-38]MBM1232801.1 DNA polymerase III subunit chi [Ponticoccus sp. SC6-45]MBM1237249.1 DNA polymerase III subunit chi [Ponticoccus sp. SC6-49]MBM1241812.1 DNA polymerase III subunit chi [Ponticoccus sp. SC2-64]MBM1246325.1 DNA polymerase III
MGAAYFYHLTEQPLEATLPALIGKARAAGWMVEVRGREAGLLDRLDEHLWTGIDDMFLPHSRAGGPYDALQPVLLCVEGQVAANTPACLMAVGGAGVTPGECAALERVCILFDGHDPEAVQQARSQWRDLTGAGVVAQYWAQEGGRWMKNAESGG